MKKFTIGLVAIIMMLAVVFQSQVQAASAIKIYINGVELKTDQPPVLDAGYTFVPFRGILEALNAQIGWNQNTQTVTATKQGTTVVLRIGARTATINNKVVSLQAPARIVNGRTLVPVRFVSESLGESVEWDSKSQSVLVTTSAVKEVGAASSLNATIISQYGDGRDLQLSFNPPTDQSNVIHYRLFIVKATNASTFNLTRAENVQSANYTVVPTYDAYQKTSLFSTTRDVDGNLLKANESYKAFVLTVGTNNNALSIPSATVTLIVGVPVAPATNVRISDMSDLGDGRDLSVSFTKATSDSSISGYRVMIVKTRDAASFNLALANGIPSTQYITVSKSSASTLSTSFSSTSRDTSGELIQNGTPYTAYVLSLSNNTAMSPNSLSAASSSTMLGYSINAPIIINVTDINNYADGRDLQVGYLKAADDSKVNSYRVFVVREADYSSFTIIEANKVASARYLDISKSAYNFSQILSSTQRDTKGTLITNGAAYRVFVMSVMNNNSGLPNTLSAPSASIMLTDSGVSTVSNLIVSDEGDYNNGQDLRVSFAKSPMEGNISQYRILVVKEANIGSFNLLTANSINRNNYTMVSLTNSNYSQTLSSSARDVNGDLIQNGISYRIFVLSVGTGTSNGINGLSSSSPAITLGNSSVLAVTDVTAADVSDHNNGQDLLVTFTKVANENLISQYHIFVVKDSNAGSFTLTMANAISNRNYTSVAKTGTNITQVLPAGARDVNGQNIQNGITYRIFVLAVANNNMANALSNPSNSITPISTPIITVAAPEVQDITALQVGNMLELIAVSFTKPASVNGIDHYAVLIVPTSAGALTESNALSYQQAGNYKRVEKTEGSTTLTSANVDITGAPLEFNVPYQIYILSIADGTVANLSKLANSSAAVQLIP